MVGVAGPLGPVLQGFGRVLQLDLKGPLRRPGGPCPVVLNPHPETVGAVEGGDAPRLRVEGFHLPVDGSVLLHRDQPGAVDLYVAVHLRLNLQRPGAGLLQLGQGGPGVGQLHLPQAVDLRRVAGDREEGQKEEGDKDPEVDFQEPGPPAPSGLHGQALLQKAAGFDQPPDLEPVKGQNNEKNLQI